MYGNNPIILLIKINKNNEINKRHIPFEFNPKIILNSLFNFIIIIFIKILNRLGNIQNVKGIMIKHVILLIQFKEKSIEVDGSNAEKRLVIIFT